ncbi:hypothetical protein ABVT39_014813 [Epinephelus coioides]
MSGPLIITHHSAVTVPLRKCTCSHFLLFVWGGLALGRYGAKLEHQSAQKTRKKKDQQTLHRRRTTRHRPPAFGYRRTDMQLTENRDVCCDKDGSEFDAPAGSISHPCFHTLSSFCAFFLLLYPPFDPSDQQGTACKCIRDVSTAMMADRPVTDAQMTGSPTSVSQQGLNTALSSHAQLSI